MIDNRFATYANHAWTLIEPSIYHKSYFAFVIACILVPNAAYSQISGTVFRDFNANGIKDNTATFDEVGLSGITITAYNAAGTTVGTAISGSSGAYTVTGVSGLVRVEFTGLQAGNYSSTAGGTSVQFVNAPASGINFAVNYPQDYNTGKENATLATPNYVNGSPLGGGTSGQDEGFIIWNYTNYGNGTSSDPGYKSIPFSNMGTVWGLALDKQQQKLYTSAFIKRHSGLGAGGLGAIYAIDYNAASPTPILLTDVTTYPGVNIGSLNRVPSAGVVDDPNELPINRTDPSWDIDAFAKVGKEGLGGLTISDDNSKLYVINLFQRNIIEIALSASGTASFSQTIAINDPGATNGDYRPWGIKYHQGKLYVGIVATAQTSQQATDLHAYVVQIDPSTGSNSSVYDFSLGFGRGAAGGCCGNEGFYWQPWADTYTNLSISPTTFWIYPQPILSDIEFDVDGSMILGFMDRLGHQGGISNYLPNYPTTSPATSVHNSGDIIRICNVNGTLQLENNGLCPGEVRAKNLGDGTFNSGADNNQGPGGGEFYWGDFYVFQPYSQGSSGQNHQEIGFGGLTLLEGSKEVVMTSMDPTTTANSAGVIKLNNSNGRQATPPSGSYSGYRLYEFLAVGDGFGKAIGLGDIEAISSIPPLEIGNRIWTDTDSDGIQDADEAGIDGITVQLYEGATLVGTTTTTNGGQWFFNNTNVNQNGATELKPNTAYIVRVVSAQFPTGQSLTISNFGGAGQPDVRDNDASLVSGNAEIVYTTGDYGQNDHTLDIGFSEITSFSSVDLSLIKTVNTAISPLNGTVTFTLSVSNDIVIPANNVVVTDYLPAGVTFISSSEPASVNVVGNILTWNVGSVYLLDALPRTLDITVSADTEGSFVNTAEITSIDQTDVDSTPNNDIAGEDDQDQACFSVPVKLCSDNTGATITITSSTATSWQWYVSTDNGATYTALSGETNQTLTIDNTLMGGNNITKYFKVAYNGAAITDNCGETMCCPIIVTTETCTTCPTPRCIPIVITKL